MNAPTFSQAFPRQLRFWLLHCLLNAAPSLGIALGWMTLWRSPQAVAAMFSAIGTFVLLYATLTALPGPLSRPDHLLSRSLRLGAKVRGWISGISILLLPLPVLLIFLPDYWCGWAAIMLVNLPSRATGAPPVFSTEGGADSAEFLPVYLTTLIEGFLLSFVLLMFCFFALLVVQARERKNLHRFT
jgi:hypothetical protein